MGNELKSLVDTMNELLKEIRSKSSASELEYYEFYHGNELIMVGTLREISDYTGFSESTLKNYSYPSHINSEKRTETSPMVFKVGCKK